MIGWLALAGIAGTFVGVLVHKARADADDTWRQMQRERGRLRH